MGTVINKTPHDVTIINAEEDVIKIYPRSDNLIRLAVNTIAGPALPDGTATSVTVFGEPIGLPDFEEGVYYIVSQLIKNALPDREDLLVPAEVVRDKAGVILGCKSLGR